MERIKEFHAEVLNRLKKKRVIEAARSMITPDVS
jgi:hypothetical protein